MATQLRVSGVTQAFAGEDRGNICPAQFAPTRPLSPVTATLYLPLMTIERDASNTTGMSVGESRRAWSGSAALLALFFVAVVSVGCGQQANEPRPATTLRDAAGTAPRSLTLPPETSPVGTSSTTEPPTTTTTETPSSTTTTTTALATTTRAPTTPPTQAPTTVEPTTEVALPPPTAEPTTTLSYNPAVCNKINSDAIASGSWFSPSRVAKLRAAGCPEDW